MTITRIIDSDSNVKITEKHKIREILDRAASGSYIQLNLKGYIVWLTQLLASVPDEYKDLVEIEYEGHRGYDDDIDVECIVYYIRDETKEEVSEREKSIGIEILKHEKLQKKEYERLKKIYGKANDETKD